MPSYEMPLLLRVMKKPEMVAALKRVAEAIFDTGGFIRKIENCGLLTLPCKMSNHGNVYQKANHFYVYFDVPPKDVDKVIDKYGRDIDIIRSKIYKKVEPVNKECTFHEEMLPPPFRPSVKKMLRKAEKQQHNKREFKYNSGLDYYPFNK